MTQAPQVLVVAPHPDDEVLGCGGSICACVAAGAHVTVLYLTSGERGGRSIGPELGHTRESEAQAALRCLSPTALSCQFLRFPDGQISQDDARQFEGLLLAIREIRPSLLYIPHAGESSRDHEQAHYLSMRAAEMAQSHNYLEQLSHPWRIPAILGYEVNCPMKSFQYVEDIAAYIDSKIAALECYRSQSQEHKGGASYAGSAGSALSLYRGSMGGYRYAEVFSVLRVDGVLQTVFLRGKLGK